MAGAGTVRPGTYEAGFVKTLRGRLLVAVLTLLALALTLYGMVAYLLARESLEGDLDQFVLDKALLLGRNMNPANPGWIGFEEREWRTHRFTPHGQAFDPDWQPRFVSRRLNAPIDPTPQLRMAALHPSGIVIGDAIDRDGNRYRMATVAVQRDDELVGYAQIAVHLIERDRELRRLRHWLAGGGLLTLLAAGLAVGYIAQQWRLPLQALGETAGRVRLETLSRQRLYAPEETPELARVAGSFNRLLDQLAIAHGTQQRFIADASHELRTPLTILQGEIEVALRRQRDGSEYRATLASCLEEIVRLTRLTENLLVLARADAGESIEQRQRVDLGTLCREVCEQLTPMAFARSITLEVEGTDSVEIDADPLALERVVSNLVRNAIHYSPPRERVTVRAVALGPEAIVTVTDTGPGIADDHLPRLFDRFYRVDAARAQAAGGAGLGLAIVKSLVEAHGGRVEVWSGLGQGSRFTVRLPRGGTSKTGSPPGRTRDNSKSQGSRRAGGQSALG
jgi:heavy metal sensor kinase